MVNRKRNIALCVCECVLACATNTNAYAHFRFYWIEIITHVNVWRKKRLKSNSIEIMCTTVSVFCRQLFFAFSWMPLAKYFKIQMERFIFYYPSWTVHFVCSCFSFSFFGSKSNSRMNENERLWTIMTPMNIIYCRKKLVKLNCS